MYLEDNRIKLSPDPRENIISFKDKYYRVDFLKENGKYIQGGNGVIFSLINEQEGEEFVIKFVKFHEQLKENSKANWKLIKRINRFEREIEALFTAKENSLSNIVQIEFASIHQIDGFDFQYYVMQKCECTLHEYLLNPEKELDIYQKTILCKKILTGIMGLHEYKMYHRDIKHDNIFFIGNEPFIGDLGLVDKRDSDIWINERGEIIGPIGWFSPEAINKFLVERTTNLNNFDFVIDKKSEIFQLGKLFWYIYQGNIPIGQLIIDDFIPKDIKLFELIFKMLRYSKSDRIDSENVAKEIDTYLRTN